MKTFSLCFGRGGIGHGYRSWKYSFDSILEMFSNEIGFLEALSDSLALRIDSIEQWIISRDWRCTECVNTEQIFTKAQEAVRTLK
jgi:hypothetical protein